MIEIDSTSGNEQAVTDFLADHLTSAGFRVDLQSLDEGRHNLYARRGEPRLVFSTHVDTVKPFLPYREDSEFIYGRGACDAKGILAAQVFAAERLMSEDCDQIGLLFLVGEEAGSDGARAANRIENACAFLIAGEPTENRLAVGSKGALRVKVHATGRAAHSAYPEEGVSAIEILMDVLNDLQGHAFPEDDFMGETQLNIGVISGGTQANIVPDSARAELMLRTVSEVTDLKRELEGIVRERADLEYTFESDPIRMEPVEGFDTTVVAFATDIPLLTNWGRPYLLGPGSILDAHTDHERIAKEELAHAVDVYCRLAGHLLQTP